jgi:CubicO group peptidase (beta-lactamase class C family)
MLILLASIFFQSVMKTHSLRYAIAFLAVAACSPAAKRSGFAERMDAYFGARFPQNEPGVAVRILGGDSVVFSHGYGLADIRTREPITTQTLFNLGSISKTFVANAILILQERGKLSVEDSLIKYFPGFRNKDIARRVKIKHLLTHTSGLPDRREVNKDTVFYLTAKDAENWAPEMLTDTLEFEPGTRFNYSNPAFNGLALIVEQVSGMKWQEFIAQQIFKPAGMRTSTITDGPHPQSGVAHGYIKDQGVWIEDDYGEEPTFPAAGNGGVWSSVEEMAQYEKAIQQHIFLTEASVKNSRAVKQFDGWQDEVPPFIGWSWFINRQQGLGIISHPGSQGGFLTNYVVVPDKQIFFVILCNTPREAYEMKATTDYILEEIKKEWP